MCGLDLRPSTTISKFQARNGADTIVCSLYLPSEASITEGTFGNNPVTAQMTKWLDGLRHSLNFKGQITISRQ